MTLLCCLPLSAKTRVLSESAAWVERGTRTICLLEAGVDGGCDGTFVERIAVLSENIANCKENIRLSPLPSPVRPTWNLSQI